MLESDPDIGYASARRWAVAMGALTLVIAACALVFLPGPVVVVIPVALAVPAIQFAWTRRWLRQLREHAADVNAPERDR